MGVDTKGFIATPVKDVLLVCRVVENALDRLVREGRQKAFPQTNSLSPQVRDQFESVSIRVSHGVTLFAFNFKYAGEERCLNFFFDCDCDHENVAPLSLSMSMGCWGESQLYVRTVLHALSLFGAPYFDANDCDAIDAAPLASTPLTLLEAVASGFVHAHQFEEIVEKFESGDLRLARDFDAFVGALQADLVTIASKLESGDLQRARDFEAFVGASRADMATIASIEDHSKRWSFIEALAAEKFPKAKSVSLVEMFKASEQLPL